MSAVRVVVLGAGGRMGSTVCDAVAADRDLQLVAAVDPTHAGQAIAGVGVLAGLADLDSEGIDVAIDFTAPAAVGENVAWCATAGVHAVVGTSGLGDDDLERFRRLFPETGPLGCMVVANFAIGAVLMMRFAELAAPWFETAEIVELHHDGKRDAPSGTALGTARRMAAASGDWAPDPTRTETVPGARGASGPGGIPVHAVRLRGLVAHQEVLLGTTGETLTIRHDSLDRSSFMPGVVLAAKAVGGRPGLTVGLDAVLRI